MHNRAGNKCHSQGNTDTRENPSKGPYIQLEWEGGGILSANFMEIFFSVSDMERKNILKALYA